MENKNEMEQEQEQEPAKKAVVDVTPSPSSARTVLIAVVSTAFVVGIVIALFFWFIQSQNEADVLRQQNQQLLELLDRNENGGVNPIFEDGDFDPTEEIDTEDIDEDTEREVGPGESETVTVTDPGNHYAMDIPASWVETDRDGPRGLQVSRLFVESDDFASHTDPSADGPFEPVYYDTGAALSVAVLDGVDAAADDPAGVIDRREEIVIDGETARFLGFQEPSTFQGYLLEARFALAGRSYIFRYMYNPETLPEGEDQFRDILDSVQL